MDKKKALDILIAHACCASSHIKCDKCPFDQTYTCEEMVFDDVLEEAVNIILEGESENEKNEIK